MKKGFTLIELLVYMAIMGFIIVVAGRAFSDSTSMRVRTQSMTKATEEVNRIAEIIKEDLSQMGAKVWYNNAPATGEFPFKIIDQVYVCPTCSQKDSSSFKLWHKTKGDSIEFRKISYDEDDKYIGTRLITWYADNKILYRRCATIHPTSNAPNDPESETCPVVDPDDAPSVIMAEDVEKFTLNPSKPSGNFLIPSSSSAESFGGENSANQTFQLLKDNVGPSMNEIEWNYYGAGINTATLSGFERNNNIGDNKQYKVFVADKNTPKNSAINSCEGFTFKKGETYAIKFKTPMYVPDSIMATFVPGVDHIAVGFRDKQNGGNIAGQLLPNDFMFYPPQSIAENINQYFEFSVSNDAPDNGVGNVCIVFTLAFYSGENGNGPHLGKLQIKDFELLRKLDKAYTFVAEGDNYAAEAANQPADHTKNKKNVKAFELILKVEKKGETGSTCKSDNGACKGYVIPVPNNGIAPPPSSP